MSRAPRGVGVPAEPSPDVNDARQPHAGACASRVSALSESLPSEVVAALSGEPEDELVRVQLAEAQKKKRSGWKRWVMIAVSVAIIGLTFAFVLPKIADYAQVWDVVKGLSWQWLLALVLAGALNVATCAPELMAALP